MQTVDSGRDVREWGRRQWWGVGRGWWDLRQPIKLGWGTISHLAGDSLCWLVTSTPSLLDWACLGEPDSWIALTTYPPTTACLLGRSPWSRAGVGGHGDRLQAASRQVRGHAHTPTIVQACEMLSHLKHGTSPPIPAAGGALELIQWELTKHFCQRSGSQCFGFGGGLISIGTPQFCSIVRKLP